LPLFTSHPFGFCLNDTIRLSFQIRSRLIEASKFAEIVSPKLLADAFDCYSLCITYEHEKAIGNGTIDADYEYIKNKKEYALSIIRISIRNELTRYDSFSRKYLKRIKKLMNKYIYSSSD